MIFRFLLVSLNVDAILGEITLHQRRKRLDQMTKGEGLGDAYATTLSRIRAQQRSMSKLGMEVLMWVSHSERPLHVDELCHALGVEEGSTDLNVRNIPAIETLLTCCLGLVTVEKSSSTVRLVHYTLQEHLSHNPKLFIKPHSTMAEVCLTYLNFRHIRGISPTLRSVPPTVPFVKYASCYWGAHAKRETTEGVKRLALKVLNGYDKHISSKVMLLHSMSIWDQPFDREDSPTGFTGLHGAAYLGCVKITVALLETHKWDVRATDLKGNTAIAWAARRGHEGVVRILLARCDVDPNAPDESGRTPVSLAAKNGHEGVVRVLLERDDVIPDTGDILFGRTPLSWAAQNGHEGVVIMLLGRHDVKPDTDDILFLRTPLSWAAQNGHEEIVKILLERDDVNPDTANKYCRTPLSFAAENGHEGVVKILLERNDVNPDTTDATFGRTPLSFATENEHEGVVRILLERTDVNPNTPNRSGRTPLSWAAQSGREGIVRMLLARSDVNSGTADRHGQIPLSQAARNGHDRIIELLGNQADPIPRYAASPQPTELFSPKPSELPGPPFKRTRRF